jgi:hypothetical protein
MRYGIVFAAAVALAQPAFAQTAAVPDAVAVPGATILHTLRGTGAQIYECKPDALGKLTWVFREPIATLTDQGKTVGRHYAGPTWELTSGSAIVGVVAGSAPGATPSDIPWLKLTVISHRGSGAFDRVTEIQRLRTEGGVALGICDKAGALQSVPYAADYVFLGARS